MIMSWLDKYREASFRNVEFNVPAHEHSGGRRNAIHELPGRDEPDVRDLGSKLKKFTIDAFVIGNDYNYDRDALLDALDKGGPGKLVHPYLGTLRVSVDTYSLREQSTERRMARFSITFVQAGLVKFPTADIAPAEKVAQNKATALTAVNDDFVAKYDLTNKVYSIVKNVKEGLNESVERMGQFRSTVSISSEFQRDFNEIQGSIASLAFDGVALASGFINIINFGTDLGLEEYELTPENARTQYDELRNIWQSFDNEPLNVVNENDPTILNIQLCQRVAVISAAGLFNIMQMDSWDEAREVQRVLFAKMQELAEDSTDDDVFAALMDLRASVYKEFESIEGSLPRLVVYTPPQTINSLFLTYYLYGNIDRESEILDRNKVEHPGFIPGQRPLEVILDVN